MALDELRARRLATVASIVESALDRMELVLKSLAQTNQGYRIPAEQIQRARDKMIAMRETLHHALEDFSVRVDKPDPRQVFAAELATLWVVLENARPERMTGYGRGFAPEDRKSWDSLIRTLLEDVEQLRHLRREMGDGR